ncbi:MAG: isopenicillin N synthase family dioxygenase [Myxococcota bacterium]
MDGTERLIPLQTIPVVSLQDYLQGGPATRTRFIETLGDALVDLGFFALDEHLIDAKLIDQAYGQAQALFDLPESRRRAYEDPSVAGQRGYTSFGREHARDTRAPDLKEFWHVGRELDADPRSHALPYRNVWPSELAEFRSTMNQLFMQLDQTAMVLLEACSIYMGEAPHFLPDLATYGDSILRIIHYPPVPEDRNPNSIRASAHEDINLITLLCEATAGGLELLQRDGQWRPIHALGGQIVVDSGDMLQHISNRLYKSTTHRVVNPYNSRERRFSMPFFVHPRPEVELTPRLSSVDRTGGQALYPERTAGQYLMERLREIGLM